MEAGLLAVLFIAVRELLAIVAAGVAVCSLDDLLIDVFYFARVAWRRLTIYRRHPRASAHQIGAREQPMAILVPAWNESAVIAPMLRHTLATIDYPHYRIFVGVYPNDVATRDAIATVVDGRVAVVENPRDGPTTKGDNLNALWRAALEHERAAGTRFGAMVLHDAEDVVHARELRIFDHLIPHRALVQLPVAPLPDRSSRWVAGTYQDEFAEAHMKDLVAREALGAAVPSAGVACAIERDILERIADAAGGAPFDPTCLTEDYEIGLRVHALGGRGCLVRMRASASDPTIVATREHFPASFDEAVRQKSRWLLGIALQGWDRIGWQGGLANRLMLLRDRKSIVAALFNLLAYICLALVVSTEAIRALSPTASAFPPLAPRGEFLHGLLVLNLVALAWRIAMRAGCVWTVCGPFEAAMSVPRILVGNVINMAAAYAAVKRYLRVASGREPQRWDKTAHRFPDAATLAE